MGEDDDLVKEASVLNRIVRWHPRKGITYEADPRHAAMISRGTGAEELKTISTPAANATGLEARFETSAGRAGSRRWRHAEFRRGDEIQKDCSMSELIGRREDGNRVCYKGSDEANDGVHQRRLEQTRQAAKVNWYKYRFETEQFIACTGSDWAGCRRTTSSTSGGCIHRRQHMLKFWSKTQAVVVAMPWTLWVARAPRFCARN